MTKITAILSGVLLIFLGASGFVFPNLFGMHLTATNNLFHFMSGVFALFAGTIGSVLAARAFCTVFGVLYGVLGVAGLLGVGADHVVTLIPNHLVFGTLDHVEHIILGGILLLGSLYGRYKELAFQHEGAAIHRLSRHP